MLLANAYVLAADWDAVARHLPANTNTLAASGWLASLAVGRSVTAVGAALPWYTYPAIEFLEDKIAPDFKVFEWGAGQSTMWWAHKTSRVVSVESDEAWFNALASLTLANVRLSLQTDEAAYVGALAAAGEDFDVVIVDGAFRNKCAAEAASVVAGSSLIVFDNTDMRELEDGVLALQTVGWHRLDFFGLIPQHVYKNCTSVFFKDMSWIDRSQLPSRKTSCLGPTCAQAIASLGRG